MFYALLRSMTRRMFGDTLGVIGDTQDFEVQEIFS